MKKETRIKLFGDVAGDMGIGKFCFFATGGGKE